MITVPQDTSPSGGFVDIVLASIVHCKAVESPIKRIHMPQHKSAIKRVRQNERRRLRNRYHKSRMRTMIKGLQSSTDKKDATARLNEVKSYLDRLAAKGIVHRNTAANYKGKLEKHVAGL
ncbi:MAG: 30S ribosomal protein S20 [Rhodothermales bacterium]|nr:30S ribosomal protein S20 [Rhodothermales bacterium]